MEVIYSSRVEELADRLAAALADAPPDPFTPDVVLVEQSGMARWLAQRIAHLNGVCCNVAFVHPDTYMARLLGRTTEPGDSCDPYSVEALHWTLRRLLEDLPSGALGPVHQYVMDRDDSLAVQRRKRSALAARLAAMYRRYLFYRGDMLSEWAAGGGDDWQAELWRAVRSAIAKPTPVEQLAASGDWDAPGAIGDGNPQRVCVFGLSGIAPLLLRALASLSQRRAVTLFRLLPSVPALQAVSQEQIEALPPLLRRLSTVDRDFNALLNTYAPDAASAYLTAGVEDAQDATTLAALQADLRHARHRGRAQPSDAPPLSTLDSTVQIHACHGQIRQVEVLRNALLRLFADESAGLQPRDVVVMCPNIELWSPLIRAVFDDGVVEHRDTEGPLESPGFPRLRHMVADRSVRKENPVAEALLRILDLALGRMPSTAVLDLLTLDVVRSRFGFDAEDLGDVQRLLTESGFRWGLDAAHRAEEHRPEEATHTLRFATDRLLLGLAMDGHDTRTFHSVLPIDDAEAGPARVAGAVAVFCSALAETVRGLRAARPFPDWVETLEEVLDRFVKVTPNQQWLLAQVTEMLAQSAAAAKAAGASMELSLQEIVQVVSGRCSVPLNTPGFVSGAITFCALLPMRSIPFKVVCLLGMDDGEFPRRVRRASFDALEKERLPGDRDPRTDDRYLLLEAIMAAREHLIVTYAGYSARSNAELAAAPAIAELIDTVARLGLRPGQDLATVRADVVRRHPLHAFSPREFGWDDRTQASIEPQGFDQRMLAAAHALCAPRHEPAPFLNDPLEPPSDALETIRLLDLRRCLEKGTLWYLMERVLGVREPRDLEPINDEDPLQLDPLERWAVGAGCMTQIESCDRPLGETRRLMRLGGLLPLGTAGDVEFDAVHAEASRVVERAEALNGPLTSESIDVDLAVGDVRLVGRIDGIVGSRRVLSGFSRMNEGRVLAAWFEHVVLAVVTGRAIETHLISRGTADEAAEVSIASTVGMRARAGQTLQELVDLFVMARQWPIPFVPKPAQLFAANVADGQSPEAALKAAQSAFKKARFHGPGEPCHARLMPEGLTLERRVGAVELPDGWDFAAVACRVWGPALDAMDEVAT